MASPGQVIGHYRVTGKLGAGGMGEVWRATDTKLGREVAIKLLPAAWAGDAAQLQRLKREARVLAGLNHRNIAAIYGLEDGAFVMELIEGRTLAELMACGPMARAEATRLAVQIANGLEFAHRSGVIHRDLKPANIMITRDGEAKILDFGLAYAAVPDEGMPGEMATVSLPGTIAGTPGYMSPEQARGEILDVRADIWAFGVILYEMLAGRRLFAAASYSEALVAVLQREPDLAAVPPELASIVGRCLCKDPWQRWGWMGDVRVLLESGGIAATAFAPNERKPWRWIVALGALAALALAEPWLIWRMAPKPLATTPQVSLNLGSEAVDGEVAITPDGSSLVYPVHGSGDETQLVIRRLTDTQTQAIPGSEDASGMQFFSADSSEVGFLRGGRAVATLPMKGGAAVTISAGGYFAGASWDGQGNLILADSVSGGPLQMIPAGGSSPQPWLHLLAGDVEQFQPQVLPGDRGVLFVASANLDNLSQASVEVAHLPGGEIHRVLQPARWARYLAGSNDGNEGYLVYLRGTALYGVRFNLSRLAVDGAAVLLIDGVRTNPEIAEQDALSLSANGTLVYETGVAPQAQWSLEWLDPSGATSPLLTVPGAYRRPQFSPDGSRLVFEDGSDVSPNLFVYDMRRGTRVRVTPNGGSVPLWAPDGQHLAFVGMGTQAGIYWVRSDGASPPRVLLNEAGTPWSFTPDGNKLAYASQVPGEPFASWLLPLATGGSDEPVAGKPQPLPTGPDAGTEPMISPDGRWVAYYSPSQRAEFVRPLSGPSLQWQVSVVGGGGWAAWSRRVPELYYETDDGHLMVVRYRVHGGAFEPARPEPWTSRALFQPGGSNYAVDPAADRMVVFSQPAVPQVPVTVNIVFDLGSRIERALASHR